MEEEEEGEVTEDGEVVDDASGSANGVVPDSVIALPDASAADAETEEGQLPGLFLTPFRIDGRLLSDAPCLDDVVIAQARWQRPKPDLSRHS